MEILRELKGFPPELQIKIHSEEETSLTDVLAVFDNLSDLLYHNIVAKLWCGVAVAVQFALRQTQWDEEERGDKRRRKTIRKRERQRG